MIIRLLILFISFSIFGQKLDIDSKRMNLGYSIYPSQTQVKALSYSAWLDFDAKFKNKNYNLNAFTISGLKKQSKDGDLFFRFFVKEIEEKIENTQKIEKIKNDKNEEKEIKKYNVEYQITFTYDYSVKHIYNGELSNVKNITKTFKGKAFTEDREDAKAVSDWYSARQSNRFGFETESFNNILASHAANETEKYGIRDASSLINIFYLNPKKDPSREITLTNAEALVKEMIKSNELKELDQEVLKNTAQYFLTESRNFKIEEKNEKKVAGTFLMNVALANLLQMKFDSALYYAEKGKDLYGSTASYRSMLEIIHTLENVKLENYYTRGLVFNKSNVLEALEKKQILKNDEIEEAYKDAKIAYENDIKDEIESREKFLQQKYVDPEVDRIVNEFYKRININAISEIKNIRYQENTTISMFPLILKSIFTIKDKEYFGRSIGKKNNSYGEYRFKYKYLHKKYVNSETSSYKSSDEEVAALETSIDDLVRSPYRKMNIYRTILPISDCFFSEDLKYKGIEKIDDEEYHVLAIDDMAYLPETDYTSANGNSNMVTNRKYYFTKKDYLFAGYDELEMSTKTVLGKIRYSDYEKIENTSFKMPMHSKNFYTYKKLLGKTGINYNAKIKSLKFDPNFDVEKEWENINSNGRPVFED